MQTFSIPIRVYIEDTDAGRVVFYANYLKFMERARTEWLRSLGVELDVWQEQYKTLFVVRSVNIDYLMPARFNDEVIATFELEQLKGASMRCQQAIIRAGRVLTRASVTLACVNADTLRPCAIPTPIREAVTVER
ncbi:MAG: tol-pal system-associated acyl-CoA thioesterase [Granulosicoccus sp.]